MAGKKVKGYDWAYLRLEALYYANLAGVALMLPLSLAVLLWLLPAVQAANNWDVEGDNGVLYIEGALVESACRLEMDSDIQNIRLGEIGTGRLLRVGERGEPLQLLPGNNYVLSYRVSTERTRAPLKAGAYSAIVDFRLTYD
ncbi:TPA: type 1 fimbrial protein [Serratia marcescens]|nr:type 1 fimbrial protein [Serratia marcescens]